MKYNLINKIMMVLTVMTLVSNTGIVITGQIDTKSLYWMFVIISMMLTLLILTIVAVTMMIENYNKNMEEKQRRVMTEIERIMEE